MPTTHQKTIVQVRWMIRRDFREILEIENGSFEFPWCEEDFLFHLRKTKTIGMVAECRERVLGFVVYELMPHEIIVHNIAVSPLSRRLGIGRQISEWLVGKLDHHRRDRLLLNVRESNLNAQLFFKRMGFMAKSVIHGLYEDTNEDAYRFAYELKEECE